MEITMLVRVIAGVLFVIVLDALIAAPEDGSLPSKPEKQFTV